MFFSFVVCDPRVLVGHPTCDFDMFMVGLSYVIICFNPLEKVI